eukprot:CAMPEP_0168398388 /NCGR_PEP_ID=MMETSP0228-20121227/21552_1 /TAXON_ID=133427 /ORGANISM="Protoceratium reticulatum, Strain CCCM 535 (=CCMP 1889)" /LENGTH=191 /DNA_ID=CAMNT_0008411887 /DNA_START=1 /DNA_END=572 /DNA_ORIENTATION=-
MVMAKAKAGAEASQGAAAGNGQPPPSARRSVLAHLVELLVGHLRHPDGQVCGLLHVRVVLALRHRAHALREGALHGLAAGDVKPRLVHVEVVLRVRRGGLEGFERGLARPPGQELEQHQGLAVGPAADLPEDPAELQGRAGQELRAADRLEALLVVALVVELVLLVLGVVEHAELLVVVLDLGVVLLVLAL